VALSQDILATLSCMRALGAQASQDGTVISGVGENRYPCTPCCDTPGLFCGESGSTLRFLIPVALAVRQGGTFHGKGRLMQRPLEPYEKIFDEKGIYYHRHGDQLDVYGKLPAGEYRLAGDVSSQFITGLLYALPLLEGDSDIILTTPLESQGYVDMTLNALTAFGITVTPTETGWHVPGGQHYTPYSGQVEGDYSQAGFYYAAKGAGCDLDIRGMNPDSAQGDKVILDYYKALCGAGEVTLDVSQCPDLVPPLAAHAALRSPGAVTHIVGAARLRIKESDRLATVTQVLNALGGQVEEFPDSLTITAVEHLHGGVVSGYNDHRIPMMTAMAATRATGPVTILGADCVKKSYPNFWEDYAALGGKLTKEE
jgi:3-phosphoshikimate 1-carboxyvinyltransferase